MKKNNKKGFTLVELVIVVAVMAILVAVAIPTVKSITGTAKDAVAETNARTIESLIKLVDADIDAGNVSVAAGTTDYSQYYDTAITDGKLGVDGTFAYDPTTGMVTVGAATSGQYEIVCDSDAAASGEGASAATAVENSVKVTKKS